MRFGRCLRNVWLPNSGFVDVQRARDSAFEVSKELGELIDFAETAFTLLANNLGPIPRAILEEATRKTRTVQARLQDLIDHPLKVNKVLGRLLLTKAYNSRTNAARAAYLALIQTLTGYTLVFLAERKKQLSKERNLLSRYSNKGWDTSKHRKYAKELAEQLDALSNTQVFTEAEVHKVMSLHASISELRVIASGFSDRQKRVTTLGRQLEVSLPVRNQQLRRADIAFKTMRRRFTAACWNRLPDLEQARQSYVALSQIVPVFQEHRQRNRCTQAELMIADLEHHFAVITQAQRDILATLSKLEQARKTAQAGTWHLLQRIDALRLKASLASMGVARTKLAETERSVTAYREFLQNRDSVIPLAACLEALSSEFADILDDIEAAIVDGDTQRITTMLPPSIPNCPQLERVLAAT